MIEFKKDNWKIYDPDELLKSENIAAAEKLVYPREDVLAFNHKFKDLIVDFGFYGNEATLEGEWVVYLIEGNNWEKPIKENRFSAFKNGIESTIELLNEYST